MNDTWQCNNCWAKNSPQDGKCKYCGLSIEESTQRDTTAVTTEIRKKKILSALAILVAVVIVAAIGWFIWSWNKTANQSYQQYLEMDKVLDARGVKTQCEVFSYTKQRSGTSIQCRYKVGDKEYTGWGHPPPDYKYEIEYDKVVRLAPGSFVTVVYDSQNPKLSRIDGDRFVNHSIASPFSVLQIVGVVIAIILIYSFAVTGGKYLLKKLKSS